MDDMISRAEAINTVKSMLYQTAINSIESNEDAAKIYDDIATNRIHVWLGLVDAVDAVPVVHARWTTERTWKHDGEWYCSACEYEPVVFMDSAFCPNCGAKMDGERRESE